MLVGPEARLEMPYSYAKLGFGYDWTKDVGSALGMKFAVGGLFVVAEGTKLGLDFTFAEKLTGGTAWIINVGPVVSFDL